jgi:hypothetical protein
MKSAKSEAECAEHTAAELSVCPKPTGGLESNIVAHFGKGVSRASPRLRSGQACPRFEGGTPSTQSAVHGGNILCDIRFDDGAVSTANIGSYQPNIWGLYDMHGNACEWTRTTYGPYPYRSDDGRDRLVESGRKVVRGGSWCDRPKRCRSAFRLSYPAWQRVHNVGFRVVCEIEPPEKSLILLAPLSSRAGGYGLCKNRNDTAPESESIFADTNDPGYQTIMALCVAGGEYLKKIKRFDMPDFRPRPAYVREMKRYGIIPGSLAADARIDVYATDRAYWQSLWYNPDADMDLTK